MSEMELNDLKRILKQLVASNGTACSLRKLQQMYKTREGGLIPVFQFGFRHLTPYLKAKCSDCFTVYGRSSNPIVRLIQPNNEEQKDLRHKMRKNVFHAYLKRRVPEFVAKAAPVPPSLNAAEKARSQNKIAELKTRAKERQLFKLKKQIHRIVKDSENGVAVHMIPQCYRERYNRYLEYSQFEYAALVHLLFDMKDMVVVTRTVPGQSMFQCGIVRDCSTISEKDEDETPTTSASTSAELASGADQVAIIDNSHR